MGKLDGRVAIVTGAAQGIGKAIADKLAEEGAIVVGADVQDGATMKVDVSKEDDVVRMVEDTVAEHGKLDACAVITWLEDIVGAQPRKRGAGPRVVTGDPAAVAGGD